MSLKVGITIPQSGNELTFIVVSSTDLLLSFLLSDLEMGALALKEGYLYPRATKWRALPRYLSRMSAANGKAPTNERSGMRQFLYRC